MICAFFCVVFCFFYYWYRVATRQKKCEHPPFNPRIKRHIFLVYSSRENRKPRGEWYRGVRNGARWCFFIHSKEKAFRGVVRSVACALNFKRPSRFFEVFFPHFKRTNKMGKKNTSGNARRKEKEMREYVHRNGEAFSRARSSSPLWNGLVLHRKDVFVSHVISKLKRTDRWFFAKVNVESWSVLA